MIKNPAVILFLMLQTVLAEPVQKSTQFDITKSPFAATINMLGTLDGQNTYKHSYNLDVERAFEPMRSITIRNTGSTTVHSPRLVFNDEQTIYDLNMLCDHIFQHCHSPKDSALALWKFFRDHRVHHISPEYNNYNISDPLKLLGIYGYLTCDPAAMLLSGFADYLGYSARSINLFAGNRTHTIPEINFGNGPAVLDVDSQTFYLNYDNKTLVGPADIQKDHYLIRRTHHFGKSLQVETDMAQLYDGVSIKHPAVQMLGHSLDMDLRPGEAFIFDWSPPSSCHHIKDKPPVPIPRMVTNSRFEFTPAFAAAGLEELVDSLQNIQKNADNPGIIHPIQTQQNAFIIFKIESPYPILQADFRFTTHLQSEANSIQCDFSYDQKFWEKIFQSNAAGKRSFFQSLSRFMFPHYQAAVHQYFVRFTMQADAAPAECRLSDLSITSVCQTSKFNMPELKLGENVIAYADSSQSRKVQVTIDWQESTDNRPPKTIKKPIFPKNGSMVKNSRFTFEWPNARDKDDIIDYEFQLSDRPDMRFPLSPTFERYISSISDTLKPKFAIPFAGLLNHGETYYWRVRTRDSRGAWGEWSEVWSFTVNIVMMPVTLKISDDQSFLRWQANPTGKKPVRYQIHAGHKQNGFTPTEFTRIAETVETSFSIAGLNYSDYRVIAVDAQGNMSGPSRFVHIE